MDLWMILQIVLFVLLFGFFVLVIAALLLRDYVRHMQLYFPALPEPGVRYQKNLLWLIRLNCWLVGMPGNLDNMPEMFTAQQLSKKQHKVICTCFWDSNGFLTMRTYNKRDAIHVVEEFEYNGLGYLVSARKSVGDAPSTGKKYVYFPDQSGAYDYDTYYC